MSDLAERVGYSVRAYDPTDEAAVLDLLRLSLGEGPTGARNAGFFRWKHLENPFGRSFMLLAENGSGIIGFRAFMRWRFRAGDRLVRAVRAVDTATHPGYQGRGIFTRLTLDALDALRGEADLVFNTPNERSLPGYLKMGWRTVGRVPIRIRIRRPLAFARGLRSLEGASMPTRAGPRPGGEEASKALRQEGLSHLLEAAGSDLDGLHTTRTRDYLSWRYGRAPGLGYRVVTDEAGGRLGGMAILRVRPRGALWESTIAELLVHPDQPAAARRVLRRAVVASDVDHVSCAFPQGNALSAARGNGFLRSPRGMTLVVNVLSKDMKPDPRELRSWALSLGDLEVF